MNARNTHHVVEFAGCAAVAAVPWCHPVDIVLAPKVIFGFNEGPSSILWRSLRLIRLMCQGFAL
jgi:hypothetical protein